MPRTFRVSFRDTLASNIASRGRKIDRKYGTRDHEFVRCVPRADFRGSCYDVLRDTPSNRFME